MEKIEAENLLHRAFSVFLFNSKYELLLQVCALKNSKAVNGCEILLLILSLSTFAK